MNERNALYKELVALKYPVNTDNELEAGWWEKNRSLSLGDKGDDVKRLQKKLNTDENAQLSINSRFDDDTAKAVADFQKRNHLKADGIAGPFTQTVLYGGYYRYAIKKPPIVQQEIWTCWAASYQSALPSWKGRKTATVAELIVKYNQFLQQKNSISTAGFDALAKDFNAEVRSASINDFTIDVVKVFLLSSNAHLIIVTGSTVAHCRVVYGFGVSAGESYLLVMDPLVGDYRRLPIATIEAIGGIISIVRPL